MLNQPPQSGWLAIACFPLRCLTAPAVRRGGEWLRAFHNPVIKVNIQFAYHLAKEGNVSRKSSEVKVLPISSEIKHWHKILPIYLRVGLREFTASFPPETCRSLKIIYNTDSYSTLTSKSSLPLEMSSICYVFSTLPWRYSLSCREQWNKWKCSWALLTHVIQWEDWTVLYVWPRGYHTPVLHFYPSFQFSPYI